MIRTHSLTHSLLQLYKINQHWAIDYEDLSKQLLRKSPDCVVSKCANCTLLERELEEKKMLIRDQQSSLDKYHARKADWKAREQELQTVKNENKALKLQVRFTCIFVSSKYAVLFCVRMET